MTKNKASCYDTKMKLMDILTTARVIPVIAIEDASLAVDLAHALMNGGINTLEITLRTPAALTAIDAIKQNVPGCIVGAGTLLNEADLKAAKEAGAEFGVSPGIRPQLIEQANLLNLPYLPGVATSSEIILALEHNLEIVKLFPANVVGGMTALKHFSAVFPKLKFCPTGGVNEKNYAEFLTLNNVACVGGSWLAPKTRIESQDWETITALAKATQ